MSDAVKRALVIVNDRSLRGDADLASGLDGLRARGFHLSVFPSRNRNESARLIREHHAAHDLCILGGGDGTLNGAAEALVAHNLPFAILPLGTANDLARTLGIPFELEEAFEIIAQGRLEAIDLGQVNGRYFFNVASLGLGAAVQSFHRGSRKRRWKLLSYIPSIIDAFKATRAFRATIQCDGDHYSLRCIHLAVGNGRHYGGGMTIAEDAAIDDGMLDLYLLRPQSLAKLLLLAPALRSGRHGSSDRTTVLCGRRIRVETSRPKRINADGEIVSRTPAEFTVVRGALRVIVPPGYKASERELDGTAA